MPRRSRPSVTAGDVCLVCAVVDVRFGGPRRLEWDHVAAAANNPDIGVWLCRPGCHDLVSVLQRRYGVQWKQDPERDGFVKAAWLLQGLAFRLGLLAGPSESMADVRRMIEQLGQLVMIAFLPNSGSVDDEGGYKRPGPNPLRNDIAAAELRRQEEVGTFAFPALNDEAAKRARGLALLRVLAETDQALPGAARTPALGDGALRVWGHLSRFAAEGHLDLLPAVANQAAGAVTLWLEATRDERIENISDPEVLLQLGQLASKPKAAEAFVSGLAEAETHHKAQQVLDTFIEQCRTTSPVPEI